MEEQMWLKLHEAYMAEVKQLDKTVRPQGPCVMPEPSQEYIPC